jgi:hypothetical protein
MCKEMPVIPVNKVVDPKRIIGKNEFVPLASIGAKLRRKLTFFKDTNYQLTA